MHYIGKSKQTDKQVKMIVYVSAVLLYSTNLYLYSIKFNKSFIHLTVTHTLALFESNVPPDIFVKGKNFQDIRKTFT